MAKKSPQINASSMADISFLLLIFFLVTTSMDVSTGLNRQLPPILDNQNEDSTEVNKRNVMIIKFNEKSEFAAKINDKQDKSINMSNLKDKVKLFIANPQRDTTMSEQVMGYRIRKHAEGETASPDEVFHVLDKYEYPKNHVISLQCHPETVYQEYLAAQNEVVAAYRELRDEAAKKLFGQNYVDLNEDQRKDIDVIYRMNISEAEPQNKYE